MNNKHDWDWGIFVNYFWEFKFVPVKLVKCYNILGFSMSLTLATPLYLFIYNMTT